MIPEDDIPEDPNAGVETIRSAILMSNAAQVLVKVGAWFTVPGGNTGLYTGDLFFDLQTRRFKLSGIPCTGAGFQHAVVHTEPGPFKIDLYVKKVLTHKSDNEKGYAEIEFHEAKANGEFMGWLEEMYREHPVFHAATEFWEVAEGILVWQK